MQTRNDFRIPGDAGTLVELAEYDSGPTVSVRATLTFYLTERQSLRLLAAPLGRNCRFLQGPATDPAAAAEIRAAITSTRTQSPKRWTRRSRGLPPCG